MKIHWVNHASFLLERGDVRLLCDPWMEGRVFDESWALLAPTSFSYPDFERVTHIWLSHEHPDHFSPPTLRKVPPAIRKRIPVLFQPTRDKRVVRFCRDLDFKVLEMPPGWLVLEDGLRVLCRPVSRGDSWLAVKSSECCVVNLNDCIYLSEDELAPVRATVGPVDVLITQFSYASWWGNKEDRSTWRRAAKETLEKIGREIAVLQPRYVVLAASFAYFCHRDNAYMNRDMNTVEAAYEYLTVDGRAQPIVLYPGQEWNIGEEQDSGEALRRYAADYERALSNPVAVEPVKRELEELVDAAREFVRRLQNGNSRILLRKVKPAVIYLDDHETSVELSLRGLNPLARAREGCDISLGSDALLYCFRFPWGGETLKINGRFRAPATGDQTRFFHWCAIAGANAHGVYYDLPYYGRKMLGRFKRAFSFQGGLQKAKGGRR